VVTVSLRQNKAGSEQLIVTTFRIKPLDLLAAGSKPPTDGSEVESSISGGNLPCDVAGSEQLLSTNELKIDFTTPGIVAVGASQSSLAMRDRHLYVATLEEVCDLRLVSQEQPLSLAWPEAFYFDDIGY
jgi:hypothetical protein